VPNDHTGFSTHLYRRRLFGRESFDSERSKLILLTGRKKGSSRMPFLHKVNLATAEIACFLMLEFLCM
jgi:hypothetical protein